ELRSQWEYALQLLRRQEAILRAHGHTVQLRAPTVRSPSTHTERELEALLAQYADVLQTPKAVIEQAWRQQEGWQANQAEDQVSAQPQDRPGDQNQQIHEPTIAAAGLQVDGL